MIKEIKPSDIDIMVDNMSCYQPIVASYIDSKYSDKLKEGIKRYIREHNMIANNLTVDDINIIILMLEWEKDKKDGNYFELQYGVKGFTHVPPGYEKDYGSKEWLIRHDEL